MIRPLALALLLTGCAGQPRYITTPLPLPTRPELPALSGDDLECLSPEAYSRVVTRDRQRRDYAEQLEAVIRSTHTEPTP